MVVGIDVKGDCQSYVRPLSQQELPNVSTNPLQKYVCGGSPWRRSCRHRNEIVCPSCILKLWNLSEMRHLPLLGPSRETSCTLPIFAQPCRTKWLPVQINGIRTSRRAGANQTDISAEKTPLIFPAFSPSLFHPPSLEIKLAIPNSFQGRAIVWIHPIAASD